MSVKNLLCLVVDGLHAGMVGTYGNSWIRTVAMDQFASQSYVFDQAYNPCPTLEATYRALWDAPATTSHSGQAARSLASRLGAQGWTTTLVTDEPRVAHLRAAADFGETIFLEQPAVAAMADDPAATNLTRLFEAAAARLTQIQQPFLLWIHAQGLLGPWDAPYEFRQQFADEEDPPPPVFVEPPNRQLADDTDPDELLGITHAYAGQLALVDQCFATLLETLAASQLDRTTQVSLLSARGFPLGEHRRVGLCDEALYNELVQLVWMMRFPDGLGMLDRGSALVVPADLPTTLLEWLGIEDRQRAAAGSLLPMIRGEPTAVRDRIHLTSQADHALRTTAWLLRKPDNGPTELYAKPSDRWEVNDVAKLCADIASGMEEAMGQSAETGQGESRPTLAPALTTEVD